jgi:hypothetical protein
MEAQQMKDCATEKGVVSGEDLGSWTWVGQELSKVNVLGTATDLLACGATPDT